MKLEIIREWVFKAEEDYFALEILARQRKKRIYDIICFHSQQCAEKYLKALLVFHECSPPKSHDLSRLSDLLKSQEPAVILMIDLCERLTPYGVEFRYPGEEATAQEAKMAVAAAKEIRRFVRARLKLSK